MFDQDLVTLFELGRIMCLNICPASRRLNENDLHKTDPNGQNNSDAVRKKLTSDY
jgi:hypothetical protein